MKNKYLEIAEEVLAIAANHFVLVAAFLSLLGCFGVTYPYIGIWLAMIIIPLFYYFLRRKIKNFPLFFVLHLTGPILAFGVTMHDFTLSVMAFVLAAIYAIWSIKIKVKDKDKKQEAPTALLAVVVFSVGMIMQTIWGMKSWSIFYMILVFAYFACYYIYLYLNQYSKFMLFNKNSTANIPEKEIFTSGMAHTVIYTIGGLGILFLSANLGWFTYLTGAAGNAFLAFLRFIIAHLPERVIDNSPIVADDIDHGDAIDKVEQVVESSDTFENMLLLVIKVFIICLIVLGIYLIIRSFRNMWKNFAEKQISEEMMTVQNEVRESLDAENIKRENKERNLFGFMDNKEKVRKFYKKRVTKEKSLLVGDLDKEHLQYMTAKECCDKMAADNLKNVYNKVRYSAEEISAEDVRLAKSDGK